jgi:hypothetical protein
VSTWAREAEVHDAGRPTYTKLDLATRVREDRLELDGLGD